MLFTKLYTNQFSNYKNYSPRTRDCKGGEAVPERSGGMTTLESPVFAAVRMQKWPQPLKIRIHQPFRNIPDCNSFILIQGMFCSGNYHFWVGIFYAKKWCSFSFHCFWAGNVICFASIPPSIANRSKACCKS